MLMKYVMGLIALEGGRVYFKVSILADCDLNVEYVH